MPYISIRTTKTLGKELQRRIKSELGALITLIPGKAESTLMIDFAVSDGMYFKGEEMEECAFVNIKLFGTTGYVEKAKFTTAVFNLLADTAGIGPMNSYITIDEYDTWGTQGKLK